MVAKQPIQTFDFGIGTNRNTYYVATTHISST